MSESSELIRLETTADSMGTTFAVVLHGARRDQMEQAVNAAFDELQRLHNLLSIYRPMRSQPVEAMRVTFSLDLLLFRPA